MYWSIPKEGCIVIVRKLVILLLLAASAVQSIEHKWVLEQACRVSHLSFGRSVGQSVCPVGELWKTAVGSVFFASQAANCSSQLQYSFLLDIDVQTEIIGKK